MSALIKILIAAILILLGTVGVLGYTAHSRAEALKDLAAKKALVDQQVADLQKSIKTQQAIAVTTDKVTTEAVQKTEETTTKVVETNKKVDKITKQVADEKISTADADAAYLSSMWDTFCEAQPANGRCTSR